MGKVLLSQVCVLGGGYHMVSVSRCLLWSQVLPGWGGGCQSLSLLLSGGYPNLGQGYPTPSQARDSPLSRTGRWLERLTAYATRSLCPLCNGTGESQTEQEWYSTPSWCGLSCPCPSLGPGGGTIKWCRETIAPPPLREQTHKTENITFHNLRMRTLKMSMENYYWFQWNRATKITRWFNAWNTRRSDMRCKSKSLKTRAD